MGAWFLLGKNQLNSPSATVEPETSRPEETLPKPPPGMMREADLIAMEANGPRTVGRVETRTAGGDEPFEKVFGGSGGVINGEIRVEGAEYPETWTVTIEPSLNANGRDEAITRTFVSEPGMRTFELRDLPLAAYRLSATAPGLTSSKVEVALFRVAGRPGARGLDLLSVGLTLRPMAQVEGFVRQADGDVASDIAVHLVPYILPHAPGQPTATDDKTLSPGLETRTNTAGSFLFEGVPPGPWMLHVGDPIRPLVSPVPVGVDVQDQRVDDVMLPPLATLELVVLDHLARPCPDVELSGYLRGNGSGQFKAVTDAVGRIRIPYLTPGPWRVDAVDPLLDQKGRGDYALTPERLPDQRIEELHIR